MPDAVSIKSRPHLDTVKRQLLQDPDWATVCAARPLEIAFTPAEEIEQFGKRRKLNDRDRKRLSAAHGHYSLSSLATLCRNGRDASPRKVDSDQIKIRIDGRPAGLHSGSQGKSTSVPSSQSMLLDHETSQISHSSAREEESFRPEYARVARSSRLTLQPSYNQPMLEKSLAGRYRTSAFDVTEPLDNIISGTALDYRTLSCSPATTLVASPAPSLSHVLPDREDFSWLPNSQHFNDSSSPKSGRLHATSLRGFNVNRSSYPNSPAHLFRDFSTTDSLPDPVRLYGQLINIRNHDIVETL
ncbi:hypothetical protein N7448_010881 [Penicillium atrosanguineum]|uniref:uncharacterized protein n=1 Tax=Penicillium atrosanguineum TaxID=1132637 RepID=UPI00238D4444|nr:uncharacterized protein N7443_008102 [Penicillium atrosanguineum]KAJ5119174.1 hypothetical protein N7526_010811 [Penicillium atrosanguineum]KAJ5120212.1 hypothetical protein N7448_010881 [Penicillium atrosanguineum]KAJ5297209.1 hypothetical protein N7443_008102 [Penicillium atrosanguineum]